MMKICRPFRFPRSVIVVAMTLFLPAMQAYAQVDNYRVTRLEWQVGRDEVSVTYDLDGTPDDEYRATILLRRDGDPEFRFKPLFVSGKIGEGEFAGKGNVIRWAYKKDYPEGFKEDDYYIELLIERVNKFPWLIAAGGATIAGIVVILATNAKSSSAESAAFQLPFPPPRP